MRNPCQFQRLIFVNRARPSCLDGWRHENRWSRSRPRSKTFRFTDIDEFRSSVRNLEVDFTPLVRRISAEQTVLDLAGCSINLTRSFPRISDGCFAPNCTAVGFTMDDGVPIRFNGVERDQSVLVIGSHGAAYTARRTGRDGQYASIVFTPTVEDRGWPQAAENFRMFETSLAAHFRLREVVRQVLSRAPELAHDIDANEVSSAIRESLLAAVDSAFAAIIPARWASRANASGHSGSSGTSTRWFPAT